MAKKGKKYLEMKKAIDRNKLYDPKEAIELLKKISHANFDQTVEVAVRLGVDPRHADQQVRGTVILPHGTGKTKRVLVFAKGEKAKEAQEAGADYVGAEELIEDIQKGWLEFDVAVATPDMMGAVGKLGRILGPKGLMPNPKAGTVTPEPGKAVQEIKAGKVEFRVDKAGIVHSAIGKLSFPAENFLENFYMLMDALQKAKPASAKGVYMRSVVLSSTFSPGIKISPHLSVRTAG